MLPKGQGEDGATAAGCARLPVLMPPLLAVLLAVTACAPAAGPRPQIAAPERFATARSFAAPLVDWPADAWWRDFGDSDLTLLIDEALSGAPDLAVAAARVRQADALAETAGAALDPAGGVEGGAGANRESINTGISPEFRPFLPSGVKSRGAAAFRIERVLDLFGRDRATLAAATSEAQAVRIDQAAARIEIAAAVAIAYAELRRLRAAHDAATDALRIRTDTLGLVGRRRRDGLENDGRLAQARAAEAEARLALVAVARDSAILRNRLAALVGAGPDRALDLASSPSPAPAPRAIGLPADAGIALVGRRPDIVAARLRTEAAARRIDAERAAFYPDVRLAALIGVDSIPLDRIAGTGALHGQAGPAFSLPLFRSKGPLNAAGAAYDAAVAQYDATLVAALRDVADAIVEQRAIADGLHHAEAALAASEEAYRVARLRYRAGLSSYLDVLTSETAMLAERRRLADLRARRMTADVVLIRALGGGFHVEGATPVDRQETKP